MTCDAPLLTCRLPKKLQATCKAARKRESLSLSGEPKRDGIPREIMPADGSNLPSALNGDFGTSPLEEGRPSEEPPAYPSPSDVAKSKDCCQFSDAATALPSSTMSVPSQRDFQQRLEHAPQHMCRDLIVCRVFKEIAEARSRAWITSAARIGSSWMWSGPGTHVGVQRTSSRGGITSEKNLLHFFAGEIPRLCVKQMHRRPSAGRALIRARSDGDRLSKSHRADR